MHVVAIFSVIAVSAARCVISAALALTKMTRANCRCHGQCRLTHRHWREVYKLAGHIGCYKFAVGGYSVPTVRSVLSASVQWGCGQTDAGATQSQPLRMVNVAVKETTLCSEHRGG